MEQHIIGEILLRFLIILIAAKIAGWICHRLKQSAVLGELIVGMFLGVSLFNIITPEIKEVFTFLAELGVIILLFEVGLESNIYKLLKVGLASSLVAVVGVILPFLFGFLFFKMFLGSTALVALFVGATLTATSVGVTMRIFSEKKLIDSNEGKVILGAAVIDDVLGLIILSVLAGIVEFGKVSLFNIGKISLLSILFLAGSIYFGIKLAPLLLKLGDKLLIKRTYAITAMVFAFSLAYIADLIGLATIVGAFAAGLILEAREDKDKIRERIKPLADVFVPIFFVNAGMLMDVKTLADFNILIPIIALFILAVISKIAAGAAAIGVKAKKLVIGLGMIPRGEVGIIFATFGLVNKVIMPELYALLVVVIMLTTFIAPPLLSWSMKGSMKGIDMQH
ncbi:MAG: cation:proton antiporter [Nanoarchaeota archaeon]